MAILITILEVGSDVVMSGGGSANTSSLTSGITTTQLSRIYPSEDFVSLLSPSLGTVVSWTGIPLLNPNMGGGGITNSFNRSGSGLSFGMGECCTPRTATLYLDSSYVSGNEIGPTIATFTSQSFTSLGINTGTYTWTWGSGATADSFTVQVGPLPTPTPTVTSTQTPTPTPSTGPSTFYMEVTEVGSDVIVSGSGKVNTTSLTISSVETQGSRVAPITAFTTLGPTDLSEQVQRYSGITGPTNMGSGGFTNASPFTYIGNGSFGIEGISNSLYVPVGYSSNDPISGTTTYLGKTISSLGFTPGTYTWTWGTGLSAGTFVVQVGPVPTPTPTVTSTQTNTPSVTPSNTPTLTPTTTTTPTTTQTPTTTTTNTPTPTINPVSPTPTTTPTNTVTQTPTDNVTDTPTPTPTTTPTPTVTATNTATPTNTASVTPTPSETPNVCKTYDLNGGTTDTTFFIVDCNGFTSTVQVQAFNTLRTCSKTIVIVSGNGTFTAIGTCPLPTPTPSVTATITPSNTATPSVTPSVTATNTPTLTQTPTVTPTTTQTSTPTQTGTAAVTPSATATQTPTVTPTNTVTPSITASNTPTQTQTGTPAATPTPTTTQTPTQTQTGTPNITPTPSFTPNWTGFSADEQYAYTIDILGGFSGGTAPAGAIAPHPVFTDEYGAPISQLNGITLGGFDGLNN